MSKISAPPKTTILILGVPAGHLIGIDVQFFHSSEAVKGIKLIPDGVHVIHWGKDQNSIRSGRYLEAKQESVYLFIWDDETETMKSGTEINELNMSKEMFKLGDYYAHMIPYPENTGNQWSSIMSPEIKIEEVCRIIPLGMASSVSTSESENELLRKSLQESAQSRSERTGQDIRNDEILSSLLEKGMDEKCELRFTEIDPKRTWGTHMIGAEVTKNYLDKSWYLNNVLLKTTTMRKLFTEIQVCFTLILVFANYSGAEQWKRLCELLLQCKHDFTVNPRRYVDVIQLLGRQMRICPVEYFEDLLQRSFVANMYVKCNEAIQDLFCDQKTDNTLKSSIADLEAVLVSRFGIDITEYYEGDNPEEKPVLVDI